MKGTRMKAASKVIWSFVVTTGIAGCNGTGGTPGVPQTSSESIARSASHANAQLWGANIEAVCPEAGPGEAQCLALVRTGTPNVADGGSGPNGGFAPAQLQAAYNLPSTSKGSGQIVAIVDAYDDPNAASDLAYYRSYFGLPAANFTKYNQEGQTSNYPTGNTEWGLEETEDVDMVSASCPNCSIYLVEANSSSLSDLGAAEVEAVTLGAHIVSNSYGCLVGPGCDFNEADYDTPGVTYVAAAGDWGYTSSPILPAGFDSVVSAGGTSLYVDPKAARGFHETVWLGTGSGCTPKEKKPSWQHDPGCKHRTANDVASLSDPATGPAIYDTYGYSGWLVGGGTSAASPFIAGIFGLAGNASSQNGGKTFWQRSHEQSGDLFHIEHGYNGSCTPKYLCTDGTREYYDYGGPTGWGTPNGIGAF
jgi:subtilase family serine protease